jgi:hypothetical protein
MVDTSSIDTDYIDNNFLLTDKYFLKTDTKDNKDISDFFKEKTKLFEETYAGEDKNESIKEVRQKIKELNKLIKKNNKNLKKNENVVINSKNPLQPDFNNENYDTEKNTLELELKSLKNINNDLIKNQQIYHFGILPIESMPSSYIPLNYKNYSRNLNRIARNDIFTHEDYGNIFSDFENSSINVFKSNIQNTLEKLLKSFNSDDSLYNKFKLNTFSIVLIIIWSIVIITLMTILFYYYSQINYILSIIVIAYLTIAIVWKMIYTVQN